MPYSSRTKRAKILSDKLLDLSLKLSTLSKYEIVWKYNSYWYIIDFKYLLENHGCEDLYLLHEHTYKWVMNISNTRLVNTKKCKELIFIEDTLYRIVEEFNVILESNISEIDSMCRDLNYLSSQLLNLNFKSSYT